jgi:hypothetical protein
MWPTGRAAAIQKMSEIMARWAFWPRFAPWGRAQGAGRRELQSQLSKQILPGRSEQIRGEMDHHVAEDHDPDQREDYTD